MSGKWQRHPLALGAPIDRVHLVVEVDDIEGARDRIDIEAPLPQDTSWGARLFRVHDPDGVPVTFLQWISTESYSNTANGFQFGPGAEATFAM